MSREDDLSAFERWESPPAAAAPAPAIPAVDPIATARELAYIEGYAAGSRAGEDDSERIRQMVEGFTRMLDHLDARLADSLRDLALDVARQVVVGELAVRPEHILEVVRLALQQVAETSRESRLLLNPADAGLVRARLETTLERSRIRLVEDARIVRGGCRIETPHGDIDATLQTRWRQVAQALGSNQNWLES